MCDLGYLNGCGLKGCGPQSQVSRPAGIAPGNLAPVLDLGQGSAIRTFTRLSVNFRSCQNLRTTPRKFIVKSISFFWQILLCFSGFRVFTKLCHHCHNLIREHFYQPVLIQSFFVSPPLTLPTAINLLCVSLDFSILDISCQ